MCGSWRRIIEIYSGYKVNSKYSTPYTSDIKTLQHLFIDKSSITNNIFITITILHIVIASYLNLCD